MNPDLSILIVNYRGWAGLKLCLDALIQSGKTSFSCEIIVVDNQSNDGTLAEFREQYPQVRFVENSGNHGFAHGCNLAASCARANLLLFLNPDTRVTASALDRLYHAANSTEAPSILTCDQVDGRGRSTRPWGTFPDLWRLSGLFRAWHRWRHRAEEPARAPDWISGSLVLISRESFQRLGGWSEDYWLYYEDVDLCKRAQSLGLSVGVVPDCQITHVHGGATRINLATKAQTKAEVYASLHTYISKYFVGWHRPAAHLWVLGTALILGLPQVLLGGLFWYVPSLRVRSRIYRNRFTYYRHVLRHRTWISPRAPRFPLPK